MGQKCVGVLAASVLTHRGLTIVCMHSKRCESLSADYCHLKCYVIQKKKTHWISKDFGLVHTKTALAKHRTSHAIRSNWQRHLTHPRSHINTRPRKEQQSLSAEAARQQVSTVLQTLKTFPSAMALFAFQMLHRALSVCAPAPRIVRQAN